MSKNENNKIEYEKAIVEIIFLIEIFVEYIEEYFGLKDITNENLKLLDDKMETQIDQFYVDHKGYFYKKDKTIFNNLVRLDNEITTKIEKGVGLEYEDTKGHWISIFDEALLALGSDLCSCNIKDKIDSFSHLFQSKKNIDGLFMRAIKSIKYVENEEEYIVRLINVIEILENRYKYICNYPLKVKPNIKYWLKQILTNSNQLLQAFIKSKRVISSDRVRAFILNSLIEAAGIKAVKENKEKFIAEILNTNSVATGQYFNDFKIASFGMKENSKIFNNQIKMAKKISELLLNSMKSKENDDEVLKGNEIVNKMLEIISSVKSSSNEEIAHSSHNRTVE